MQADWGYNAIANGGNQAGFSWRTPTNDEWGYLFNTRADAASKKGLGSGIIVLTTLGTVYLIGKRRREK